MFSQQNTYHLKNRILKVCCSNVSIIQIFTVLLTSTSPPFPENTNTHSIFVNSSYTHLRFHQTANVKVISHRVLLLAPLVLMFAPELVRWLLTRFLGGDCEVDMRRGAKARGPADAVHRGEETKTHRREQSRVDVTAPLNLAFGRKKGRLWLNSSRFFCSHFLLRRPLCSFFLS